MVDSATSDVTVEELIQRLSTAVVSNNQKTREEVQEILKLENQLSIGDRKTFQEAKSIQCLKTIQLQSISLLELLFSKDFVFVEDKLDFKTNKEFICCAIQADFLEGVKFLIDNGLKLESETGDQNWIALFQAVEYGKTQIVDFLVKKQPNHVHSTLRGMTLVGLACKTRNLNVIMAACLNVPYLVKYFIENGADLTSCDSKKNTALHYLCKIPESNYSLECIERFVEQIKIVNCLQILDSKNIDDDTPLYFAVTSGNVQVVDILVDAGCDVNVKTTDESILSLAIEMKAIQNPTSDIVAKLITAGSNVNASDVYGYTPLMQAASCKDLDSMKLLIQHGADIHSEECDGDGIVDYCFDYRNIEGYKRISCKDVLEFLHNTGAWLRIENFAERHLGRILYNDDAETLEYLISNGLDIYHIGENNRNILHLLPENYVKRFNKIKPYCDEADVNQQDTDGDTPLMCVVKKIFPIDILMNYCLERGADVNLRNKKGQTLLMIVAANNKIQIFQQLIDAGADVNIRSQDGRTALQFLDPCIELSFLDGSYLDCLKLFLENGGARSIDYKDLDGLTPLQYVLETKRMSFMWYLITQNCSFSSVSDRGKKIECLHEYQFYLLKLAKIFYHSGAPRQLILDIFKLDDSDEKKFKRFCDKLSLTELCRRQIRMCIGPGIQEKLQTLNIAPKLIQFICLRDLIPLKMFDINNIAKRDSHDEYFGDNFCFVRKFVFGENPVRISD